MLSVEVAVAISVLLTIVGVIAAMNDSFGKLNNHLWAQHTCNAAAQAQMDSIAVTGEPIEPAKFALLWPSVTCQIQTADGTGQWQGMTEVRLFLSRTVGKKEIHVAARRYIRKSEGAGNDN